LYVIGGSPYYAAIDEDRLAPEGERRIDPC
jgi:hypothetical protein